jgi:hypothetical protein
MQSAVQRRKVNDTAFPRRSALYFFKAAKRARKAADVLKLPAALAQVQRVMAPLFPGQVRVVGWGNAPVQVVTAVLLLATLLLECPVAACLCELYR